MLEDDEWSVRLKSIGKCCVCEGGLSTSEHINLIQLNKVATWKYPVWGNILYNIPADGASAIACDACIDDWQDGSRIEVKYAFEFNLATDEIVYHPIDELEEKVVCYGD